MTDIPSAESLTQGLVEDLLREQGLGDIVSRSRQLSVLREITRQREAVTSGDEGARWQLAQALERFALTVRDPDEKRRLFDEAFICRRALDTDDLPLADRLGHLLCLSADGLAADRRAELVMLLRAVPAESLDIPADIDWSSELLLRIARAFTIMARRSQGWDDVTAAAQEIARLRELQASREPEVLADAGPHQLSSLVALYNLARMVDMAAEYLVSGTPGDIGIRLDRHHANVSEIFDLEQDAGLEHLADLLHAGLRALIEGSVWTATRGLGQRIALFVEGLASEERDNPVLELWPSQRTALRSSLLDPARRALVVQMPTSAGKTLVAEFAIVQALALNPDATVAYVVPTRALVNQITLRLRADLIGLDLTVEAAVPVFELDPVEDTMLRAERIHVLVTTPEKLDLLLRQAHPSVNQVALIVADEAHGIGDGERGARLELMLAAFKRERPDARFLLLSPFLPNASEIAAWLGDDSEATVSVDWKPTELVTAGAQWVKPRNQPFELTLTTVPTAHFVELDTEVAIPLGTATPQRDNRSKSAVSVSVALRLADRGSVLILCRGRGTAEVRATQIANERQDRTLSELGAAILAYAESELGTEHPLPRQLRRGVAYHHAGLSHDLRYLLERIIDAGDLDVVCGTTTLAQGVNFPIASVIIETLQKPNGTNGWQPLKFAEFWNIAGRAGRALRDRLGLVVFPADNAASLQEFRQFIQNDAKALASVLVEALAGVDAAASQFDLAFVRRNRSMAVFTQYLAHALAVGGYENAKAEIEDLLRSSLVYHQALDSDPGLARDLITLARRYLDSVSTKNAGYLRLADGTGFSLASVDMLYAQQRSTHPEFVNAHFWQPEELFAENLNNLTDLVSVLGDVPELNLGHSNTGPFNPHLVAGVIADWTGGLTVNAIADKWFTAAESDPDKRRRLAGHYLYSKLVGQIPWGMGAIQRLALTDDSDIQAVGHVPSLVFYGVRTKEAAALRMAGVPRIAAEGLGRQWTAEGHASATSFNDVRSWLTNRTQDQWSQALPQGSPLDGGACQRVWSVLAGVSGD
jgi:helicase